MRVAALGAGQLHEQHFLLDLLETCEALGHKRAHPDDADLLIVWNGRGVEVGDRTALYVECGWLPRWWYQVSHSGINAEHHAASPDLSPIGASAAFDARSLLRHVREFPPPPEFSYADATRSVVEGAPYHFVLVPLQVEADTNMRHVPRQVSTPQGMVRYVESLGLPVPVVFKLHPAAVARGVVVDVEPPNIIAGPERGTVHQWLRHDGCELVIVANSNVAHDALLWDRPVVTLGHGIWPGPERARRPFEDDCLGDLGWHREWHRRERQRNLRLAYVDFLLRTQWRPEDARDLERVAGAIEEAVR